YLNQENTFNAQLQNWLNSLMQRSQLIENEHNNLTGAYLNQENTFNAQLQNWLNSLMQRSQLIENEHNNLTGAYLNQENTFNAQFQNWLNSLMQRSQLVENEHNNLTGAYLNQENTFNAQFQNALNALMQMAQLDENAKNNLMTALVNKMNAYNSQISNWLNTTAQRAGYVNQQFGAVTNSLNAHAQLYEQLLNNANAQLDAQLKAKQTEFQLNGDMWMRILQALKQRNDMCGQWYEYSKNISDALWQHSMMALEAGRQAHNLKLSHLQIWNALISMYLGNSTSRITMSAGAQEAAQNAAIRLWNASTGLNQSATGVLVALSNQGTKTTTQQESSSSFWGGLFGGVASAFAGGYAGALGSAK
ncbi:MAG: hypothetical protein IJP68_01025, partial [Selenomonadaceae bacterium]|nr:hypothetical protein [Selenomonadaceae bacterium]